MRNWLVILLIVLFSGSFSFLNAQDVEEPNTEGGEEASLVVDTVHKHSPKLATWMSVVVPGAGQFYNKKYWKIPIIYGVGGVLVYTTMQNSDGYQRFLRAYTELAENPDAVVEGYELYSLEQLKFVKDQYRRNRDLSIIGLTLLYVLNIVDATVDGYLFDYDVSDNLSLRVEPSIMGNYYQHNTFSAKGQFGLKCTINF